MSLVVMAHEVLWLIVSVLAGWTLTNFLSRERGPFGVATWFRSAFGISHDESGHVERDKEDGSVLLVAVTRWEKVDNLLFEIGMMLTCFTCCSFWVAIIVALVLKTVAPTLIWNVESYWMIVFALSASMIAVDRKMGN